MFNLYLDSGNDGECGDMACCEEKVILKRFNPDTGRPEISSDGGVTWKSDPSDPEYQVRLYPPLVNSSTGKTKCDAATNASEHVNELITATGENLSTAGDVYSLVVAIAAAILALVLEIVTAGAIKPLITAVAAAVWAAGQAAFDLGVDAYNFYWTVDKQDLILCILYCTIGSDGQWTEAQYQEFRTRVKAQLPASPALDIVMTSINAVGARGLSQMASYGNAAESDCASCDCPQSCPDNWHVYAPETGHFGEIIEYGEGYLIAQTTGINTNGSYYIYLVTNGVNDCCYLNSYEVLEGSCGLFVSACGQEIGAGLHITGGNECINQIQPNSPVPFKVRFNLAECP